MTTLDMISYNAGSGEKTCHNCERAVAEVSLMVDSNKGFCLCDLCIQTFNDILSGNADGLDYFPAVERRSTTFTPADIVGYLDEYIIGQTDAKQTLAVAAYHHYQKINYKGKEEFNKSNVLLVGPTGSGKTALIEKLAKFLDVPFVVQDTVQLTTSGYVGEEVEDVLARLYEQSGRDLQKAQKGIICLDEIDKVAHIGSESKASAHALGVQRMLLKPLERDTISVTPVGSSKTSGAKLEFDTSKVLFIASGAFTNLPEIINERVSKDKGSMGFTAAVKSKDEIKQEYDEAMASLEVEDLVTFGFMPEFIGRFPNITKTKVLTLDSMKTILLESKNSVLMQTKRLLAIDHVSLVISDEAITEIAQRALNHKTGARALGGILNGILKDAMFAYPSSPNVIEIYVDYAKSLGDFKVELVNESLGDIWTTAVSYE